MNWQIYTDGAWSPDGRGGWAYVVVNDNTVIRHMQGSALGVTHQRMEIRAVAEALLGASRDTARASTPGTTSLTSSLSRQRARHC